MTLYSIGKNLRILFDFGSILGPIWGAIWGPMGVQNYLKTYKNREFILTWEKSRILIDFEFIWEYFGIVFGSCGGHFGTIWDHHFGVI